MLLRTFSALWLFALLLPAGAAADDPSASRSLPAVEINDNRQPAGTRGDGSLVLQLRAQVGKWRPQGDEGPTLEVDAFSESDGPPQVPSPLIRVPRGTEIVASIRNDLEYGLRVHGLCARDGTPCAPVEVPPAGRREVRFVAAAIGTFHYWATTTGSPLPFRAADDTQLGGAFIVDPPDVDTPADRIFVITDWTSVTRAQMGQLMAADDPGVAFFGLAPDYTFLVNGRSWPSTERLVYRLGEDVRWRVVNLSSQPHPMHLHGFYFTVDSVGDGARSTAYTGDAARRVVTQLLNPGATMSMTWTPERLGKWVFHCHISDHISPKRRLAAALEPGAPGHPGDHARHASARVDGGDTSDHGGHANDHSAHDDGSAGMAGLILGVTIVGDDGAVDEGGEYWNPPAPGLAPSPTAARQFTIVMRKEASPSGPRPTYGFALQGADGSVPGAVSVPGPTLVLKRGEPVEIALVNQLPEATSIHWHGLEIESYYDGVHGWGGVGTRVTPLIQPGERFMVRFAPPRAGTFIYHTHMHDDRQLGSGMYGALVVVEPGETFDPGVDHVMVIGTNGSGFRPPIVLNGGSQPFFVWKAGTRHRIRFINITADEIFVVSLGKADGPVEWTPVTKDGAAVPPGEGSPKPASVTIAVGETYDFEYETPPGRLNLWVNVRTPGGRWAVQGQIAVKPL